MDTHFDLIVIGGGSGGYAAARTAREVCERVAIVDGAKELGGLCILRGCMPSKTLIYSAEVLHLAQKAKLFGLDIPLAVADMKGIHERKNRHIEDFASYRQEQLQSERFTLFRSYAKFSGAREITLNDGTVLTADKFVIATGSQVNFPAVPGLDEVPVWTSDDVLELDNSPESVLVLGGGIVACELAQFLARTGTKVIQVQRSSRILKEASEKAAHVVEQAFRDEGIELFTGTALKKIEKTPRGVSVTFEHRGELVTREAVHLFNALGRKPATDSLKLEAAGIETQPSGHIVTGDFQVTTNPNVYAVGDCAGPYEIVHVAIMQGESAARHATNRPSENVDYSSLTGIIFTDPQVTSVGPGDEALREQGFDILTAEYPFDDHGKSLLMEATYGYVKVTADKKSGRLLAAECVGKDASELIHAMAVAVSLQADVRDLLKVHWYHPTLSEIWSYPLEDIVDEL